MAEELEMFENLSNYQNLDYVRSDSAEGLKKALLSIRLPFKILALYPSGGQHYAWISTTGKIKKIPPKKGKGE